MTGTLGQPYGGELVNLLVDDTGRAGLVQEAAGLPSITIDNRTRCDLELLTNGGFSPLRGFMGEADYTSVVDHMALDNGLPWTIPITLAIDPERASELKPGTRAAIRDESGDLLAVIDIEEQFRRDLRHEAVQVYRTDEEAHPGVAFLYQESDTLIAGPVTALKLPPHAEHNQLRLTPADTRAAFAEREWKTVVGFQTRNPIHRAHEYLIKVALESVDGALIHPLIGDTKDDDIPADVRIRCYEALIERYFVPERIVLGVLPAAMRYAGPREAVFHSIMRKNFGCTHFIVGRDHAGVANYYGTYDAQLIFSQIDLEKLGIQPVFFEHAFFCTRTGQMATDKTSPAPPEERIFLSGTKVREMLRNGQLPPDEFSRPEVARILIESMAVAGA